MGRNILKSSVQDASFSIIFQILFRCMSFVLNAFIIRHVGQIVLGIMNVRLLLLESTILFLCKEPFSKACLTNTKSHNWTQVINQIWLSVPLTCVLSGVLTYVWINLLSPTEEIYTTQYETGCYCIAISCVISQISQCFTLVAQSYCFVKLKVVVDTFHIVIRTIVFVVMVLNWPDHAINAFSVAQIVSVLVHLGSFIIFFMWYIHKLNTVRKTEKNEKTEVPNIFKDMNDFQFESITDFCPTYSQNTENGVLNKELCVLTVSFMKQCVVKQLLTEGERYVMTISPVMSFSQQSMYDIVNNLGSLAARFIFRPIEESSYFYFTQMLKRDVNVSMQDQKSVGEAVSVLKELCQVVTSLGLTVVVFGQAYSETLLYLYGGNVLTSDPLPTTLLRCHCFAVLLLAINGVTECYAFATMSNIQLDRYNYIMVVFSIIFLLISYFFTYILGPVGFIIANCVNMLARITHSLYFIQTKYKNTKYQPLYGLIPKTLFVIALVISAVVTYLSKIIFYEKTFVHIITHIVIGGICFIVTLLAWAFENKQLLKRGLLNYKRRLSVKVD